MDRKLLYSNSFVCMIALLGCLLWIGFSPETASAYEETAFNSVLGCDIVTDRILDVAGPAISDKEMPYCFISAVGQSSPPMPLSHIICLLLGCGVIGIIGFAKDQKK